MRIFLKPAWVSSKNDNDDHFIGVHQLMHLYGLRIGEFRTFSDGCIATEEDLILGPQWDGNYVLPEKVRQLLAAQRAVKR